MLSSKEEALMSSNLPLLKARNNVQTAIMSINAVCQTKHQEIMSSFSYKQLQGAVDVLQHINTKLNQKIGENIND